MKSTVLYTLTSFLNQFGNLLILPLIWKGLEIEDFAIIGIIEASTPILVCIFTLACEQYVTRFYFTWADEERKTNIGKNLTLNMLSILLLGGASVLLYSVISDFFMFQERDNYFNGLLHIVFFSTFAFPNSLFRITNQTRIYIVFTLTSFFVRLLLNYIFTITLKMGLEGYILSNTLNSLLFCIVMNVFLFVRFPFKVDRKYFKSILGFTIHFVPTNILTNITNLTDRLVLSVYGGKFAVGILTLGQKIASIIGSFAQAIKLAYVPHITAYVSRQVYSIPTLNKSRMTFLSPISIMSLFLILFGSDVLMLVDIEVSKVNKYLPLFLLIVYLNTNNLYFSPGLYLAKRSDKMWLPNFFQLIVRLVLYFLLVPAYFLEGILVAAIVSNMVLFVFNYYLSEKYFKLNLSIYDILIQFVPFLLSFAFVLYGMHLPTLAMGFRIIIMLGFILILCGYLLFKNEKNAPKTT